MFAVLLGAQPLEQRLARMDDEGPAAGGRHLLHEAAEEGRPFLLVDADPAFDRHRKPRADAHRRHGIGHEPGLGHEPDAEAAAGDPG